MNPTRDEILRILKVLFFQSADVDRADIQSLDIMRYAEAFLFTDDRQIPDIGKVKSLIADIVGSGVIDKLVTVTVGDTPSYELDLSAETDIPYPANATLYVNKKAQPAATWDFDTKKWSGLPDTVSGDVIEAYYIGREYVPPVFEPTLLIDNNSTQNVDYTIGVLIGTILPGNELFGPAIVGQSASLDLLSGQSCVYTIYNSDNSVYFTFSQTGPGTINGLPMTSDQKQEFIVGNTLP